MKCISLIGGERCQEDRTHSVALYDHGYAAIRDPVGGLFCRPCARRTAADLRAEADARSRQPRSIRPADRRMA